jgi:hypothetical protein
MEERAGVSDEFLLIIGQVGVVGVLNGLSHKGCAVGRAVDFRWGAGELVLVEVMAKVCVVKKALIDLDRAQVALEVNHWGDQCRFARSDYNQVVLLEEEV